jgi:hypothetical protein
MEKVISNIYFFKSVINAFLPYLQITYSHDDYKNARYSSALTFSGFIELGDTNLQLDDLIIPLHSSLLVEFLYIDLNV